MSTCYCNIADRIDSNTTAYGISTLWDIITTTTNPSIIQCDNTGAYLVSSAHKLIQPSLTMAANIIEEIG